MKISNEMFQFYLFSGQPIDLREEGLGVIYQPKLKHFIHKQLDVSNFSEPFFPQKEVFTAQYPEFGKIFKDVGSLEFIFVYDKFLFEANISQKNNLSSKLVDSLCILYKTANVKTIDSIGKIIVDDTIIIGDKELDFLSQLVLEMFRIDAKEVLKKLLEQCEQNEAEDELTRELNRRAREYEKMKNKKSKSTSIVEVANIVTHFQGNIAYKDVLNMTIYQIKNSYEAIMKKEIFNINLLHRISPNFKVSEELKLWEEQIRIVESNLSQEED